MYRTVLSVFYPMFFILVIPSLILLIFIILRYSPDCFQTFKYILLVTCISQIVAVTTNCLIQIRQVSNLTPMEIWCYGPLRHFTALIAYSTYFLTQTAVVISNVLIFLTIYLKYLATKINTRKTCNYGVTFFILSPIFIALGAQTSLILTEGIPSENQDHLEKINFDISDHAVIGYIRLKTLPSIIITFVITGTILILPAVGLLLRKKTLRNINSNKFSITKKALIKGFINGVTLQVFLPLICYIPVFGSFLVLAETKTEVPFEQYFFSVLVMLPMLFDPYIILYSVAPYRKQIEKWIKTKRRQSILIVDPAARIGF
ncbi:Serpentine receptor class delta-45 [Caenorhabditis elegans]|uniref:Serpentine receptor class delta-45 n=1 Tax=Caenorhabditis elegans TaxID=6239 RepID=SRD45_CAEEL|nr:Serpentine receptor class delta-45 [Caenorhabditis elegans]Q19505.1 RecName: Full=Serpentine receptor class delta-45; Short=Protein srd-45 [Caenorhabditis elegans]CAA92155.1 Serpentine receptor class delta-45 [Caenorhabditis elegans]|eukprot:NP_510064.1 Serpentine receptor class delta-45 [Caenorhabditis elegans]